MKKFLLFSLLTVISCHAIAAKLLPGARIYYAKPTVANDYPVISGKIIHLTDEGTTMVATNYMTVPNHFPSTLKTEGEYSVTPDVKNGYMNWTKPIQYKDSKTGHLILLQFSWDPYLKCPTISYASPKLMCSFNGIGTDFNISCVEDGVKK